MNSRTSKASHGNNSGDAVTLKGLSGAAIAGLAVVAMGTPAQAQSTDSYELVKTDVKNENSITKYEYNLGSDQLTPLYYDVKLTNTTYGQGAVNEDILLVPDTVKDVAITVKYDKEPNTGDLNSFDGSNIEGNWFENSSAIYNSSSSGIIGNIDGDFVGNYSKSAYNSAYAGAIYNKGEIGDISGNFMKNSSYLYSTGDSYMGAYGGAIYNTNKIGNITGSFIANSATDNKSYATYYGTYSGGAIYNSGSIKNIVGDFVGNYTETKYGAANGVAIYNTNKIEDVTGNFIGNYAKVSSGSASGSAISNSGSMGNITGDFIGNYILNNSNYESASGAISNGGTIKDITGDFIGNYITSTSHVVGGAISNSGTISNVAGDFINNHISGGNVYGGAIYNSGKMADVTGNFIGNYAISSSSSSYDGSFGGVIYNVGTMNSIEGDFIGNYALSSLSKAYGGAIYNSGKMADVAGNFIGNYVDASTEAMGGAIYFSSTDLNSSMQLVNSSLIGNYAKSATGTAQGGAIWTDSKVELVADGANVLVSGNYVEDSVGKRNEAIYLKTAVKRESIGDFQVYHSYYGSNVTTTLYRNVYLDNLVLNAKSSGAIVIDDIIQGESVETVLGTSYYELHDYKTYPGPSRYYIDEENNIINPEAKTYNPKLLVSGDKTGVVQLNNDVKNIDISLEKTQLHLGRRDNVLDGNNLTFNSGTFNMINNQVGVSALNSLTINGNTDFVADVDLAAGEMDRFEAQSYGTHTGNLNVVGMNLLSDAKEDNTSIYFAENGLKNNVVYGAGELPNEKYQTVLSSIYKYNVTYDKKDDGGYFNFVRGVAGGTSSGVETFNPAILGSSTSATVGAIGTVNQTFNHAFGSADTFMNIPYLERVSMRDRNKYALSGDTTEFGVFSPTYTKQNDSGVWVKPYASFESVDLKNGPKVSNITYGTLVGFDSEMQHLRNGWDRVITGYVGYNGASQRYSGVDSYQNGGLLGGTVTMYKGNFFNATTLSVGASVAQNQNMYGSEDFAMLLSGIGNKTGYNFEFKEGKVILQPSMLMSYTFVNTFDYTNAAGVRIDNKPLHALQLAPGVKLIGNLKGGWQPYASVSMVWNLMGESDATANGVRLPQMSIKPYVQYGLGLQKRFKDRCMAYGQAMIQNGGRNGISLTAGFRWALGKEGKGVNEKVQNPSQGEGVRHSALDAKVGERKVLKQLSPEQRLALGGKLNSSRTANAGKLRQY